MVERISGVTRLAIRLTGPGDASRKIGASWKRIGRRQVNRKIIAHLGHPTMAVLADKPPVKHNSPEAPGISPRMALVAGLIELVLYERIDYGLAAIIQPAGIVGRGHIIWEEVLHCTMVLM